MSQAAKDQDFLTRLRKQFEDDMSDERALRDQAKLDLAFEAGDQWDARQKSDRVAKGRPALTFNRCHTFVQQIANEARQNKPQIKFVVSDGGDPDTAEVKEGMARHIQYSSDAQVAYETAVEYAAAGSFGYFRFLTDYCDYDSWDQELKVLPVYDPFAIYGILIPTCFGIEPSHAFVIEDMPRDEFERQHPKSQAETDGWDVASRDSGGWISTETVRIAEYWWIDYKPKEITRTVTDDDGNEKEETRTVQKPQVKFCKTNGYEILKDSETKWPGYCIPIIPVLGKQRIREGKPELFSIVRFQRDPQTLINAYKTRIAEICMVPPVDPFILYEGQVEGHEREWTDNSVLRPWRTIKAVQGPAGEVLPPPQRQVFEPPIGSLAEAAAQEIDDMKATAGIYDASLGQNGNETSGKAIFARQQQSNITNMHFMDNLERAFKRAGAKVIAPLIPIIYDAPRMVRILGADESPKIVKINQPTQDENGKSYHYKVGGDEAQKDDVIVTVGRAFSTKRMESFDMMTQLVQGNPQLLMSIGDILFRNSDLAGSEQLAERFQKMLPPQLQDGDQSDPKVQLQQAQAQIAQLTEAHQQLNAVAQNLEKERDGKLIEAQTKKEIAQLQEQTRLEIIRLQEATKLAVAEMNASKDANESIADREIEQYRILHDSAHDAATQASDQAHERDMAERAHQQTLEQGAQQGAITAGQQAADQAHQQTMAEQSQAQDSPEAQ